MSGDGGFAMLMGDLLTLRQHDLPVKLIVFKNDSLAFVELESEGGRHPGLWNKPAQSRTHEDRGRSGTSRFAGGNFRPGRTRT